MYIQTRYNGLMVSGFYKKYLYPKYISIKSTKQKKQNNKHKIVNSIQFLNQLKYLVLAQLKGKNNVKHGKIILSTETLALLKKKYNVTSYFKSCINILEDYNISRVRFLNQTDFCEITEFYGRIHKPRKFNFLGSEIYSAPFFSFKYLKANEVL